MKSDEQRGVENGQITGPLLQEQRDLELRALTAGRLDERLIFRELEPLLELKGTPEAAARLREILRKAQ